MTEEALGRRFDRLLEAIEAIKISHAELKVEIQQSNRTLEIKIRESRFGPALVIESSTSSGGYVLGFRIDPAGKLHSVAHELSSLHAIHIERPEFGVQYMLQHQPALSEAPPVIAEEVQELDDGGGELSTTLAAYYAGKHEEGDRPPQYCPELGLAVEALKDGFTLASLWEVIPSPSNSSNSAV